MSKKKGGKTSESGDKPFSPVIRNKKARFQYQLLEKVEAGVVLVGTEVKSLRQGRASLEESFCRIRDDELFLLGCNIPIYEYGNMMNHVPVRDRKLLLHKRQIRKIETQLSQKGLTLIPTRIYFSRGKAKVELALAQGKTTVDKRDKIRDRQVKRDMSRAVRKRSR